MEILLGNDELFPAIWEQAADAMAVSDADGIVIAANPAYFELYGYAREEVIGKSFAIIFPETEREDAVDQYRAVFAAGTAVPAYESVVRRADGASRIVESRVGFIATGGRTRAMLSIIRDITARKQAELALREQTEILQTVNRIGRLLSAELDLRKLVQAVTDAATDLTGAKFGAFFYNLVDGQGERYTLYTLSGVPHETFAHFPMPRNTHIFGPTFRGEGVIRLDDVTRDERYGRNPPHRGMPEGHLPVTSYLAVPVVSRSGEVLGGLFFGHPEPGVFDERTERLVVGLAAQVAIAMDNAHLYKQSQDAIHTRDRFMSIAAHELRTPLTTLLGNAQLLDRRLARYEALPERERRAVRVIVAQASRLSRLITSLLDISRIEMGQFSIERAPVDLAALTCRVVEEVQALHERHTIAVASDEPLPIQGDVLRLEQVVQNLIDNAIKYSPGGGHVDVRLTRAAGRACVSVTDHGIGIPQRELAELFHRFYRGASVEARQIAGMGIGLYVVKEIVALHGGTVDVESVEGRGSTFTFALPLAPDADTLG